MCLLASITTGLQKLDDVCQQYGIVHDIVYHPVKSMCMTILSIPSLILNNADLVYTVTILMTTEISVASWDAYIQAQILFYANLHIVRKKLHLIESYCLNLYCSELWHDYSMSSIFKLRVAYNDVFRNLLGYGRRDSASSMFAINAINTYEAPMCKAYLTFRHTNNIVTCINTNTWLRHNYICDRSRITLYIFVITIEWFILYWQMFVLLYSSMLFSIVI